MRRDGMRVMVGLSILSHRNQWINISEISYETGASSRQISTILGQLRYMDISRESHEHDRLLYARCEEEDVARAWTHIMRWRYGHDDVLAVLHSCIPYAGWISSRDLTLETGVALADLEIASGYMGDVVYRKQGNLTLFRRVGENDVFADNGTSEPGDLVTQRS